MIGVSLSLSVSLCMCIRNIHYDDRDLSSLTAAQVGMAGPPGAARIHNLRRLLWPHGRDHDPRLLQEAAADGSEVRSGEPLHDLLLLLRNGGDGNFSGSLQVQLVAASRARQISRGATFLAEF